MGIFCNNGTTLSNYITIQGCKIHDIGRVFDQVIMDAVRSIFPGEIITGQSRRTIYIIPDEQTRLIISG